MSAEIDRELAEAWDMVRQFRELNAAQRRHIMGAIQQARAEVARLRSAGDGAMGRLLKVVEWLEMATTDPTVPSCVIESELDQYGRELRSVYEELRGADR